jgi:uncharacterized PurR-regulated membrane protein YhhQ (DUF165 family)
VYVTLARPLLFLSNDKNNNDNNNNNSAVDQVLLLLPEIKITSSAAYLFTRISDFLVDERKPSMRC